MLEQDEPIPAAAATISFAVDDESEEEFCTWVKIKPPAAVAS